MKRLRARVGLLEGASQRNELLEAEREQRAYWTKILPYLTRSQKVVAVTALQKPDDDARQGVDEMLRSAEERAAAGLPQPVDADGLIPTTVLKTALNNVLSGAAPDCDEIKLLAMDAGLDWPDLTPEVRVNLQRYRRVLEWSRSCASSQRLV